MSISEAEMLEMQVLRDELGTRFCRRCDYCQPCPQGIPISTVMQGRSAFKRTTPEWFFGSWFADAQEKAAECTECGECEERCPYNLPIREMIADLGEWFREEKRRYGGDAS